MMKKYKPLSSLSFSLGAFDLLRTYCLDQEYRVEQELYEHVGPE